MRRPVPVLIVATVLALIAAMGADHPAAPVPAAATTETRGGDAHDRSVPQPHETRAGAVASARPEHVAYQHAAYRACMHYLGQTPRTTNRDWERTRSTAYMRWLWLTWRTRKLECRGEVQRADSDVRYAIRLIFQGDGDPRYPGNAAEQAVRVAWCESRWTTTDRLGQYVGVGQLGTSERSAYGIGVYRSSDPATAATASVVVQVRSFYRMFVAAGRSWGRWACRPGGGGETSSWVAY